VATAVIGRIQGGGGVVELEGPVGQLGAIQRGQGMKECSPSTPRSSSWKARQPTGRVRKPSRSCKIGSRPIPRDQGILAQNDEMALGAIRALKAAASIPDGSGRGGRRVTDAVKAVNDGEMILSVAQDSHAQSQGALDIILAA